MTTIQATLALTAGLAAVIAIAAMPAGAADQTVTISGLAFAPATVNVNAGDNVTWTHQDPGVPHTVTSDTGAFDSGQLQQGGTFRRTFTAAGSFAYHCEVHPEMRGTVVVAAAPAGTTPAAEATSGPPATGTGLAPGDGGGSAAALTILVGVTAVALGAAAFGAVRTRP